GKLVPSFTGGLGMSGAGRHVLRIAAAAALLAAGSQAQAVCTFGGSGEPSLQSGFHSILGGGATNASVACVADGADDAWTTVGSIGAIDIVLELAGNAQSNTFGLYDLND